MRMRLWLAGFQILLLAAASTGSAQSMDSYRATLPPTARAATGVDLAGAPESMRALLRAFLAHDPSYVAWTTLAKDASVTRPPTATLTVEGGSESACAVEIEGLSDEEWLRVEAILRLDGYAQDRRERVWSRDDRPSVARLSAEVVVVGAPTLVRAMRRPKRGGPLVGAAGEIPTVAVAWHIEQTDHGVALGHVVAGTGLLIEVALPAATPEDADREAGIWRERFAADAVGAELEPSPSALTILRAGKVRPVGSAVRMVFTANSEQTEAALEPLTRLLPGISR